MTSTLPDVAIELAAMGELMRALGVSRTRTVQLASRPDFPAPVAELGVGKIWDLADVRRWADERGRTLHPLGDSDEQADHAKATPRASKRGK